MNLCAKDFRATAVRKTIKNFAGLKKRPARVRLDKCDASVEAITYLDRDRAAPTADQHLAAADGRGAKKDHQLETCCQAGLWGR